MKSQVGRLTTRSVVQQLEFDTPYPFWLIAKLRVTPDFEKVVLINYGDTETLSRIGFEYRGWKSPEELTLLLTALEEAAE